MGRTELTTTGGGIPYAASTSGTNEHTGSGQQMTCSGDRAAHPTHQAATLTIETSKSHQPIVFETAGYRRRRAVGSGHIAACWARVPRVWSISGSMFDADETHPAH